MYCRDCNQEWVLRYNNWLGGVTYTTTPTLISGCYPNWESGIDPTPELNVGSTQAQCVHKSK